MSELSIQDYARDFVVQAQRVAGIADEVAEHVGKGDLDAAYLVIGVSHGKLAELNESMAEMQQQLKKAGADWERARDRETGQGD
jgi:HD-like signal output (HDOD) protein